MNEWNDARFVAPEPRIEVLCALPNGKRRVGYYVDGAMDSNVGFFGIDQIRIRPTHWMPLPEAPVASNNVINPTS
jgi:hypothetical protein